MSDEMLHSASGMKPVASGNAVYKLSNGNTTILYCSNTKTIAIQ